MSEWVGLILMNVLMITESLVTHENIAINVKI